MTVQDDPSSADGSTLFERYQQVRNFTEEICQPLETEDYVIQPMNDASPTKWHIAHTSWFFETFVLTPHFPSYQPLDPKYAFLFNSYYVSAGERHTRAHRGLLSRPTVKDIYQYRKHIDDNMLAWMDGLSPNQLADHTPLLEVGLNHEQQHQELMLTDIKYVFSCNPLDPAYIARNPKKPNNALPSMRWHGFDEGVYEIGHKGGGFIFDNEGPRHRVFVEPYRLGSRLVTNGEFIEFIEDGGYEETLLWLSMGWDTAQSEGWTKPLYWEKRDGVWSHLTLTGLREVDPNEPACHISYYEADAFARWSGARLPTETEWEIAAANVPIQGNFVDDRNFHPISLTKSANSTPAQLFGDVWEWTQSHYSPYPGYKAAPGALGEYNGKFMANQFVLRGGSCATSKNHIRATYRNFFPAHARWQFMGLRLAKDGVA